MKFIWGKYIETSLVLKMSIGFVLGIAIGLIFGADAEVLRPFGTLLIHLLSLIAIPVIFLTVILAVDQMSIAQLGRMGWKLILYYAVTTAAAVFIGVGLALWFRPGSNLSLPDAVVNKPDIPHFSDILLQIVPSNLFQAFTAGDVMAILFIAVIIGIALATMKFSDNEQMRKNGQLLDNLVNAANQMFYKILDGVLAYAPIGVLAISAAAFGSQGWETLRSLAAFVGLFYLGLALIWILIYSGFLKISGIPVINFFIKTKEAFATAFFTSSSIATLPVAIDSAKKAGVSEKTAHFAMPLGAVFNSDGGALRMGISIVFAANITNLQLTTADFLVIVLIGTLLSIGTAGVPAAGLVTLTAVLTLFGLPLEIVALIAGVDAIIGMGGTASNVMGDVVGASVIDHSEQARSRKKKLAS